MYRKKFKTWLKDQTSRYDPVGDLAKDILNDPNKPDFETKNTWRHYLKQQCACDDALNALDNAWSEYWNAIAIPSPTGEDV